MRFRVATWSVAIVLLACSPDLSAADAPPTVATPAAATPSVVTGKTTRLTVTGADDGGAALLTYAWSSTGPAGVAFSASGTNAAKAVTATFSAPGDYVCTATIRDAAGQSVASEVAVRVVSTLTTLAVSPTTAVVNPASSRTFAATAKNQFGTVLVGEPFAWSATGAGTVDTAGMFTAGAAPGAATVVVTDGAKTASANVRVNAAPTVALAAIADVVGTAVSVSAGGSDPDDAPSTLKYSWTATGPKGVSPSPNGTNAAASTNLTFSAAGAYVITVTVKDPAGLTASASQAVTVVPKPTSITVAPANPANVVNPGSTKAFTATVRDQFKAVMPAASVAWNIDPTDAGTMAASGPLSVVLTGGVPTLNATVTARTEGIAGSVPVRINAPPTIIAEVSTATPQITGTMADFTVQGSDDVNPDALVYTWSATGPGSVGFSPRSAANAIASRATFTKIGSYSIKATLRDQQGLMVTSIAQVNVLPTITGATLSPASVVLKTGSIKTFVPQLRDQFNAVIAGAAIPQPTWAVAGAGSIMQTGRYTAPSLAGDATVSATIPVSPVLVATAAVQVVTDLALPQPVISPPGATYSAPIQVTALDGNATAVLRYTIDGSLPSTTSPLLPSGGIAAARNMTVSVRAFANGGWLPSAVAKETYVFQAEPVSASLAEGTYVGGRTVTLTCPTPGAVIQYGLDGEAPTRPYAGPIALPGSCIVTAIALCEGWAASIPQGWRYQLQIPTPTLAPTVTSHPGPIQVTGSDEDPQAVIHVTSDGAPPTDTSPVLPLALDHSATVTAVAYRPGWVPSDAVQMAYAIAPGPAITALRADAAPVRTTSTSLHVTFSAGNPDACTVLWSLPDGLPRVTLDSNGTSSPDVTANFTAVGTYPFTCRVEDAYGRVDTGSLTVVVVPSASAIAITPKQVVVPVGGSTIFAAGVSDQFNAPWTTAPVSWAGSPGSVSQAGVFQAPLASGAAQVTAQIGGLTDVAQVRINAPPLISLAVADQPVTGQATSMTASIDDDWDAVGDLDITWQASPSGQVAVTHPQGSQLASTLAFTAAGTYEVSVTALDRDGARGSTPTQIIVVAVPTTVAITGSDAGDAYHRQFSASVRDQFGDVIASPGIAWSAAGGGSVDQHGLATGDGSGTTVQISASVGGVSGTMSWTPPATGGGGGAEDPPVAPQVAITIESGLTGEREGDFQGERVSFTNRATVGVKVAITGGQGAISAVRVLGGSSLVTGMNGGSYAVPLPEGRSILRAEVDLSRAGATVTGASGQVVVVCDRTPPKVVHRYVARDFLDSDDGDRELSGIVYLNGMSSGDNRDARKNGWRLQFSATGFHFTAVVEDDETGLAQQEGVTGTVDGNAATQALQVTFQAGPRGMPLNAGIAGFDGLQDSASISGDGSAVVGPGLYHANLKLRDRCGNEFTDGGVRLWVKTALPSAHLAVMPYGGRVSSLMPFGGGELSLAQLHWVQADADVVSVTVGGGWFGLYWGFPWSTAASGVVQPAAIYAGTLSIPDVGEADASLEIEDIAGNKRDIAGLSVAARVHTLSDPTRDEVGLEGGRRIWWTIDATPPFSPDNREHAEDWFGDLSKADEHRFFEVHFDPAWFGGQEMMQLQLDAHAEVLTRTEEPTTTDPGVVMAHMPLPGDSFYYHFGCDPTSAMGIGGGSQAIATRDIGALGGEPDREYAQWSWDGDNNWFSWLLTGDEEYHSKYLTGVSDGLEYAAKICPPDGWYDYETGNYFAGYYETKYKRYDELGKQSFDVFGGSPGTNFRETRPIIMPRPSWYSGAVQPQRTVQWMVEASRSLPPESQYAVTLGGSGLSLQLSNGDTQASTFARAHGIAKATFDEQFPRWLEWTQRGSYKRHSKHITGIWERLDPRADANDSRTEVDDDSTIPDNAFWDGGLPTMRVVGISPDLMVAGKIYTVHPSGDILGICFSYQGQSITVAAAEYDMMRDDPGMSDYLKDKIAIADISTHDVEMTVEENSEQQPDNPQKITYKVIDSLKLVVGRDVPAGLMDINVKVLPEAMDFRYNNVREWLDDLARNFNEVGGAVHTYPDSVGAYAGANETHRMKESLAVVKIEVLPGPNYDNSENAVVVSPAERLNAQYHDEMDQYQSATALSNSHPIDNTMSGSALMYEVKSVKFSTGVELMSSTVAKPGTSISIAIPESWTLPQIADPTGLGYVKLISEVDMSDMVVSGREIKAILPKGGIFNAVLSLVNFTADISGNFELSVRYKDGGIDVERVMSTQVISVVDVDPIGDWAAAPIVMGDGSDARPPTVTPSAIRSASPAPYEASFYKIKVTSPIPLTGPLSMQVLNRQQDFIYDQVDIPLSLVNGAYVSAKTYLLYDGTLDDPVKGYYAHREIAVVDGDPQYMRIKWGEITVDIAKIVNTAIWATDFGPSDQPQLITDYMANSKEGRLRSPKFQLFSKKQYLVRTASDLHNRSHETVDTYDIVIGVEDGIGGLTEYPAMMVETGPDTAIFKTQFYVNTSNVSGGIPNVIVTGDSLLSVREAADVNSRMDVMVDAPGFGVEYGANYPVYGPLKRTETFAGEIVDEFDQMGYQSKFVNGDNTADLRHWIYSGDTSPAYVESADAVFFSGHGLGFSLLFSGNPDPSRHAKASPMVAQRRINGSEMRLGPFDVEYAFMYTCNFTKAGITQIGLMSDGTDANIASLMSGGLHVLCAFDTPSTIKPEFGQRLSRHMAQGMSMREAWHAADEETKQWNKKTSTTTVCALRSSINERLPMFSAGYGLVGSADYIRATNANPFIRDARNHE